MIGKSGFNQPIAQLNSAFTIVFKPGVRGVLSLEGIIYLVQGGIDHAVFSIASFPKINSGLADRQERTAKREALSYQVDRAAVIIYFVNRTGLDAVAVG